MTVAIFEVSGDRKVGRQVYPHFSECFGSAEVEVILTGADAKIVIGINGKISLVPTRGHGNFVHILSLIDRLALFARATEIVTGWYPHQDVSVILDPIGT